VAGAVGGGKVEGAVGFGKELWGGKADAVEGEVEEEL
jgi:hypothetical protein